MNSRQNNISKASNVSNGGQSAIFKYLWPVHKHETGKFLLMTFLMFCILFIQNIMRAQKDSIVNTMIGTEIIAFLKFAGVMPGAIIMAILYVKLITNFKGEKVFYIIISGFLLFYLAFASWILPNHEQLHISQETTQNLISSYPNFKWFILIFSKWSFSIFYIVAELWPNAAFSLLFWQFANSITNVDESTRFYPLFSVLGQTGLVFAGLFLENIKAISFYFIDLFGLPADLQLVSIQLTVYLAVIFGVCSLAIFWYLNHRILKGKHIELSAKKHKMSLKESFAFVAHSRYIRLIAILLLCYGMAINLVEGPWKATATTQYPNPAEYSAFVGGYLKYTGALTILFALLCSNLVRYIGWKAAAIITPLMMLVTGLIFFGISNFYIIFEMIGIGLSNPVMLAVSIGALQNILSKSSKYTLFDSTKEMSYVPLDEELKTKGKAAVDVIGIKLGKSISAFIQLLIFSFIPSATYASISVYLMFIFSIICIIWLWAVIELSKEYKLAVAKKEKNII